MARLKVFCTTSGFQDSIVAAPSKPAALKAWGAKTDLFSMGAARLVTDPKVQRKALDRPGEVIRLKRSGGVEEAPAAKKRRKPSKPPSRAKLEAAEKKLTALEARQAKELDEVDRALRALERKREQILRRHGKARSSAEAKRDDERARYQAALDSWEG